MALIQSHHLHKCSNQSAVYFKAPSNLSMESTGLIKFKTCSSKLQSIISLAHWEVADLSHFPFHFPRQSLWHIWSAGSRPKRIGPFRLQQFSLTKFKWFLSLFYQGLLPRTTTCWERNPLVELLFQSRTHQLQITMPTSQISNSKIPIPTFVKRYDAIYRHPFFDSCVLNQLMITFQRTMIYFKKVIRRTIRELILIKLGL